VSAASTLAPEAVSAVTAVAVDSAAAVVLVVTLGPVAQGVV